MLQDQPLPQTPTPTRKFAVHSDQLKAAARMISLPNRSSESIAITLSTNELRLRESTKDDCLAVAMKITPIRPLELTEGETISFEIPKRFLSSWGKHYECVLSFDLDKDQDALAWQGPDRSFHVRAPIRFTNPQDQLEEPRHLASLDSGALLDAVRYAAVLIDKRTPNTQSFDGLEVSAGLAMSGYLGGVSLHKSNALPGTLNFVLSKRNVANALAAIGKMQGSLDIAETEQAVFIKSGDTELSWTKAGRCPPLDRIFGIATEATFTVIVDEALSSVLIASIGSERGRIVLEKLDREPSLSLLSIAPAARYGVNLKTTLCECNLEPGAKLAFNINLLDLQRVLLSARTPYAEISIGKRFLTVKSACAEYDEISVLAGFD
jgi:hypothetical protein